MKVFLVGIGMGNPDTATASAVRAINESSLLIGGTRMLDAFAQVPAKRLELTRADDIVRALCDMRAACAKDGETDGAQPCASVLLSGDVGFYSGATALCERLEAEGFGVESIAGVSSLNYFCAKVRVPWQDAFLVSAHGRAHNAVGAVQSHAKTFIITGGATKVQDICSSLTSCGMGDVRVYAGENLSYDDERVVCASASAMASESFGDLAVMLAINERPVVRAFSAPSLGDEEFERAQVPMTKEEVRAIIVSKMRVARDFTVWDVGAGTGSVSVELALACPEGRVYAVEKNPDAAKLVERNKEKFGASNLTLVMGRAPEALAKLPRPDRVFIGGSSGAADAILEAALQANPQVRVVASAISLESIAAIMQAFSACGIQPDDIVALNIARARKAGDHHLMMAQNPVYVISGQRASQNGDGAC